MTTGLAVHLGTPDVHAGAELVSSQPFSIVTPSAAWAYGASLPLEWTDIDEALQRDGLISLRLRVFDGQVSLLAIGGAGSFVIDEIHVAPAPGPIDVALVSAPLGACERIIMRNGAAGHVRARVAIESIDCADLGPAYTGDELPAAQPIALRPVDDWPRYYGRSGLTVGERRRLARYVQLSRPHRMQWIEQLQVCVYPNDDLSRAVHTSGLYEPATMLVLRRLLSRGAVFVDIGANAGLFSMVASRWVGAEGHVYSFEPSEREYGRLLEHLRLNAIDNVTPVKQALGDHAGTAPLRIAAYPHAGLNTLGASFAYPTIPEARIETATVNTLDRFAREYSVSRVDVVKMDIEGGEYAALEGASDVIARSRPALIIEMSPGALASCGAMPAQVVGFLDAIRYRLSKIGPDGDVIPLTSGDLPRDDNVVALPAERTLF